MDQLFMIEVMVDSITFASLPVPPKKQIICTAIFGNFASLEIRTDVMGALETVERDAKRKDVDIECGRSHLFAFQSKNLINALEKCPLEITVTTKLNPKPIGSVKIPWNDNFLEMVQNSVESHGYITPVSTNDTFKLKNENNEKTAEIDIFIRLSCFGNSIATQYQMIEKAGVDGAPGNGGKQYLFKSTNNATTFRCEKYGYGSETDLIPLAELFNAIEAVTGEKNPILNQFFNQSSMKMINSDESRKQSLFAIETIMRGVQPFPNVNSNTSAMLAGRDQNKLFMNLRQLLINASTMSGMPDLDDKIDKPNASGGSVSSELDGIQDYDNVSINFETLTIPQIEKMLCKNKNCPAAIKFKEFGIGPLATGKGLGTLYKTIEAPVTYGMSQITGKADRYGPLGTYSRPKDPDEPFLPKHKISTSSNSSSSQKRSGSTISCASGEDSTDSKNRTRSSKSSSSNSHTSSSKKPCQRLAAGSDDIPIIPSPLKKFKIISNEQYLQILRLKGGGPGGAEDMPNPINACQELLEEYNKLLSEYKSALGPCGQATCPFSPAYIEQACKKKCYPPQPCGPGSQKQTSIRTEGSPRSGSIKEVPEGSPTSSPGAQYTTPLEMNCENTEPLNEYEVAACSVPTCPYKREMVNTVEKEFKNMQVPPGCGSPTCPYTRKKLMDEFEVDPQVSMEEYPHKCGGENCPFEIPDDLPPIHWDCPDPLPIGRCKNDKCPLRKKDDLLDKFIPKAQSPCHSPGCPYAVVPCTFPGCPFAPMDPCPPSCPYAPDMPPLNCTASNCPLMPPKPDDICSNPDCPYNQSEDDSDDDSDNDDSICDNSDCAYHKQSEDDSEECSPDTCKDYGGDLECNECGAGDDKNDGCPCEKGGSCSSSSDKDERNSNTGDNFDKDAGRNRKGSARQSDADEQHISKVEVTEDIARKSNSKNAPVEKDKKKKKKKKKGSKYIYSEGDKYPGIKVGHKDCVLPQFNVPYNMGWLWNIHNSYGLTPRRGWKPGAIGRTLANRIREHRLKMGLIPLIPEPKKPKKRKHHTGGNDSSSTEEDAPLKPTLQIKKKDGCFYITMNPLKDPKTLEDNENPYMDCTPLQFKITKNKDKLEEVDGVQTCYCGDGADEMVSSSSDSELDIEFTPPAGIIHPERLRRKKNVVHIDTQYDTRDCKPDSIQLEKKEKGKGKGKGKGKKDKKGKGSKKGGKKGKK